MLGLGIETDGTLTLKFINAKNTDQILYTSDPISGFTTKPLDLTDSTNKATYITDHIPSGYHMLLVMNYQLASTNQQLRPSLRMVIPWIFI